MIRSIGVSFWLDDYILTTQACYIQSTFNPFPVQSTHPYGEDTRKRKG